jgi:hypothetical protein
MAKTMGLLTGIVGTTLWGAVALAPAMAEATRIYSPLLVAQNGDSSLTLNGLKNFSYTIPDQGTFPLNNGQFVGGTFNLDMIKPIAFGDVDQDGDEDGAVILRRSSVISPDELIYLAVVTVGSDGSITNPDTYLLGDRVRVQSLVIKNGQIRLNILKHQEGDPECCPSSLVSEAYQLDNQEGIIKPISLTEDQRQEIHIQDLPTQNLPGGQDQEFQPQDDQFQIQL